MEGSPSDVGWGKGSIGRVGAERAGREELTNRVDITAMMVNAVKQSKKSKH